MTSTPVFTAIICAYNRPALLKEAVNALLRQTYPHLEIILINNGATPQVIEYLHQVALSDNRIKLVHFEENQFSWRDPTKMLDVCLNAALEVATGEYVWYQEDDDLLADDYAQKIVALFEENPECTTAAGLPVSIDVNGRVNQIQYLNANIRPKYSPGREVVLDHLFGAGRMFAAPGSIFTVKRLDLIQAGGYHRALDSSQFYGILPFGITGFDPTALFYWRHHAGQLNKELSRYGWLAIDEELELLKKWQLERRWTVFGADVARKVMAARRKQIYDHAAGWFVRHVYGIRPKPAARIMGKLWYQPNFWYRALAQAVRPDYFMVPVGLVLKAAIKRVFRTCPGLANLTPSLGRLWSRVNREPVQS